jgi:hypothetical protein
MTRGRRGREPSRGGDQWRTVTKRDNGHCNETAGQGRKSAGNDKRPQQDSNLRSRLRGRLLNPSNLCVLPAWTQPPVSRVVRAIPRIFRIMELPP